MFHLQPITSVEYVKLADRVDKLLTCMGFNLKVKLDEARTQAFQCLQDTQNIIGKPSSEQDEVIRAFISSYESCRELSAMKDCLSREFKDIQQVVTFKVFAAHGNRLSREGDIAPLIYYTRGWLRQLVRTRACKNDRRTQFDRRKQHRLNVREDYNCIQKLPTDPVTTEYYYSILGEWVLDGTATHIVPPSLHATSVRVVLGAPIDNNYFNGSRNGLMLQARLERAYRSNKLVIVPMPRKMEVRFKVVLTDVELKGKLACKENNKLVTWGDIDGRALSFRTDHRPSMTCLYIRFFDAYMYGTEEARLTLESAMSGQDAKFFTAAAGIPKCYLESTAKHLYSASGSWKRFEEFMGFERVENQTCEAEQVSAVLDTVAGLEAEHEDRQIRG